ncbi:hypothetical protein CDL12_21871 [Handroanthus impetiginosus]|uniref:Uncharacterized protein n=1 Tax=Handroanthus impetiginosus TaxID=429701 RepID=A0A2G9GJV4_9LAMI|nr:hypothetical protein CDL12_21871 [Handroanthus impetiginosus]
MAFNALKQCRSSSSSMQIMPSSIRSLASVATGAVHQQQHASKVGGLRSKLPSYGPMWAVIGIMGGMVSIACCIGIHTAKQQLFHSPSVQVTKKKRECIPEVDFSDDVRRSADKFETLSKLKSSNQWIAIEEERDFNLDADKATDVFMCLLSIVVIING